MEFNKKKLAFKIPEDPTKGLGHFIRCYKIASAIKNRYEIFFFINSNLKLNFKNKKKFPFNFIPTNTKKSFIQQFTDISKYQNFHTLIIDDYNFNLVSQKKIYNFVDKLIILDDFLNRKVFCDYYINYKFDCKKEIEFNLKRNNSQIKEKLLLGEKYWVPSFGLLKIPQNKRKFVSISFGNSFNFRIIKFFFKKFLIKNNKLKFQIFLGLNAKNYQYLKKISETSKNIKIIKNEFIIDKYINKSLLFIGSSGNSVYETSYLNIPSLFISLSPNQFNKIKSYEKMGHFFYTSIDELNETNLSNFIKNTLNNYSRICKLNKKKKIFIDKNGIKKIITKCNL